jgi:hypothetical protein
VAAAGYPGVTPISRKLLQHWADRDRENRVLFCQREAAETAIFLAEVAGRHGARLPVSARPENAVHNDGLPRVGAEDGDRHRQDGRDGDAHRLADDQQGARPRDARFAKRFLVVTPGITIRDRLRVLQPSATRTTTASATWCRRISGARCSRHRSSSRTTTRSCRAREGDAGRREQHPQDPHAGKTVDPFKETPGPDRLSGAARPRRPGPAARSSCSTTRRTTATRTSRSRTPTLADKEDKDRNADARVWFTGTPRDAQGRHQDGLRPVGHALLPEGLGLQRGLHLPVDGQRLLADGRDRVRHREGAAGAGRRRRRQDTWSPTCTCGTTSARSCPKRKGKKAGTDSRWVPPACARGCAAQPVPQLRARRSRVGATLARWASRRR